MKFVDVQSFHNTYSVCTGLRGTRVSSGHQSDPVGLASGETVQGDLVLGVLPGEGVLVEARHSSNSQRPIRCGGRVRDESAGDALEGLEVDEVPGLLGVLDQVELVGPGLDDGGGSGEGCRRDRGVGEGVGRHHVRVVEVLRIGACRRDQSQESKHVAACLVLALLTSVSALILFYPDTGKRGSVWVSPSLYNVGHGRITANNGAVA